MMIMMETIDHITGRIQGKIPKGKRRHSRWPSVRKWWLVRHPKCCICRGTKKLIVHHIVPFHLAPELELVHSNLATVCERKTYGIHCHLLIGHRGNWKLHNKDFIRDACRTGDLLAGRKYPL